MAKIIIDHTAYEVDERQNALQASLNLGFDLPYFCWHPALGSVGACRQCAIKKYKDDDDKQGKIVMACMTPVKDGLRIAINEPEVIDFRASVIEWLMANHPHDCPICDEGGECHLQDMTVLTGHNYREFRFPKRTYHNQDLGPFINHEMNRCIQCYRCTRFYREYAGGRDFDVFAAHDHVYFGRQEDGALESEFSGNLVEICPTGVFTDKTQKRHYTRKWDLQTAPSICPHCSIGCNTIPGERYGQLRRIRNRYNREINGYFLCDRGRYGYEFVNSDQRIRQPMSRAKSDSGATVVSLEDLQQSLASIPDEPDRVIGIGSPRASLEANFALRELVGEQHFFKGESTSDRHLAETAIDCMRSVPAHTPSLHDIELSDAVLVLGEDVSNVAPIMGLALRQSVRREPRHLVEELHIPLWETEAVYEAEQNREGFLFLATTHSTQLDDIAAETYHAAPDDLARLAHAVAHSLDPTAPPVPDLPQHLQATAGRIAQELREAEQPLIISGTNCGSEAMLRAAANVARALYKAGRPAQLSFVAPEVNSIGLGLIGGGDLRAGFDTLKSGRAKTVIVLENDLYRRADKAEVDEALAAADHVIVLDYLPNATTAKAHVILPAATYAESSGTLVNNEGRAQRFYEVFVPQGDIQASWRWLRDMGAGDWQTLDEIDAALAKCLPAFAPILDIAPPASFRLHGQQVPRQSKRYSGRTSIHAAEQVSEDRPPQDPDSPLAFSMEGYEGQLPAALIARYWAPHWNSVQALNKFQSEIGGPLRGGDPGKRLFASSTSDQSEYFTSVPAAFQPRDGQWFVLPLHHVFGSEPLSMWTPGIAERATQPYLALNPQDAVRLGAEDGKALTVHLEDTCYELPVKVIASLPKGTAGVPVGLSGLPGLALPAWGTIDDGGHHD